MSDNDRASYAAVGYKASRNVVLLRCFTFATIWPALKPETREDKRNNAMPQDEDWLVNLA